MSANTSQLRRGISRRVPHAKDKMTLSRKMFSDKTPEKLDNSKWASFSRFVTCLIPAMLLTFMNIKERGIQQAWREKVTLCIIFALCSCVLIWFTLFLQPTLCPPQDNANVQSLSKLLGNVPQLYAIKGLSCAQNEFGLSLTQGDFATASSKIDSDELMNSLYPTCTNSFPSFAKPTKPKFESLKKADWDLQTFKEGSSLYNRITVPWDQIQSNLFIDGDAKLMVLNGAVLDMRDYFNNNTNKGNNEPLDHAIRLFANNVKSSGNLPDVPKDASKYFADNPVLLPNINCMVALYRVAFVDKFSLRCGIANIILYGALLVIVLIIFLRFFMALVFAWILEPRLVASGRAYDPLVVMLVTCYSEGADGMKTTLESLANTSYPDTKKVIFIVADGLIVGDGKPMTTPEVAISLLDIAPKYKNPKPKSYLSVAQGSKQHNMAQIYPAHFVSTTGRRIPTILIVKCGTESEAADAKPGNRGKRDSQIMLMSFFSRIFFNERVTPFDYDLFRKIKSLTGNTADEFEIILMVDADTFVLPDSVDKLINAVMKDERIMGLCGETRISNKKESWVTSIQVFEYFISHHLGKAFESVFGGVTCLPGCFCMYRIKAPKLIAGKKVWVPILANKDVVDEYSTNQTNTLHEKNLLLLGEDRFLTTLMLKNFPTRKLVFVPSAKCRTEVPNSYKVLNSQRRRWINSTIHNLLELMLVNELCGVFCCSMRFVVFLDLIGTITLPAAICLTYFEIGYFIYGCVTGTLNTAAGIAPYLPMIALIVILFSPAVLILFTTFKLVYIFWMFIYLIIGLPVWNALLPLYAWWHFDDFSWGQTRVIEGGDADGHGKGQGKFDKNEIPTKRIAEWLKASGKRSTRSKSILQLPTDIMPIDSSSDGTLYSPASVSPNKNEIEMGQYISRTAEPTVPQINPAMYNQQQQLYRPYSHQPQQYQPQQFDHQPQYQMPNQPPQQYVQPQQYYAPYGQDAVPQVPQMSKQYSQHAGGDPIQPKSRKSKKRNTQM